MAIDARQIDKPTDAEKISEALRIASQQYDKTVLLRGVWRVGMEALHKSSLIYLGPEHQGVSLLGDRSTLLHPVTDGDNRWLININETYGISLRQLRIDGLGVRRVNAIHSQLVTHCTAVNLIVENCGRSGFYLHGDWSGRNIQSINNARESTGHMGMALVGGIHRWENVTCCGNGTGLDLWANDTHASFVDSDFSGNVHQNVKWGSSPREGVGRLRMLRCRLNGSTKGHGFTVTLPEGNKSDIVSEFVQCTARNNPDIGLRMLARDSAAACVVENSRIGLTGGSVSGCEVSDCEYGLYAGGDSPLRVSGCVVTRNQYGIHGLNGTGNTVSRSRVVGNSVRDVYANEMEIHESTLGFVHAESGTIRLHDSTATRTKGNVVEDQPEAIAT